MNPSPANTRVTLEKEAERLFGTASVQGVVKLLDQYSGGEEAGRVRVQLACLKLSKGKIDDLKHFVRQAQLDFRDVLYWAEYYGEPEGRT